MPEFLTQEWLDELSALHRDRSMTSFEARRAGSLHESMSTRSIQQLVDPSSSRPPDFLLDYFESMKQEVQRQSSVEVGSAALVEVLEMPDRQSQLVEVIFGSSAPIFKVGSRPLRPVGSIAISYEDALSFYVPRVTGGHVVPRMAGVKIIDGTADYLNLIVEAFLGDGPPFVQLVRAFTSAPLELPSGRGSVLG